MAPQGWRLLPDQPTTLDVKEQLVGSDVEPKAACAKALRWEESWLRVWSEVSEEEGVQDEAGEVEWRDKEGGSRST